MKKVLFVMFAMVLMFAFVSTAFAAKNKDMSYSGKVVSTDPSSESMVVKGKDGKERTFDVSDAKWKGYKDVNELQPGDQVKLTYANKDGKMEAKRVEKSTMKSAKSSSKKNKSTASSREQGTSSATGGSSSGSMGSTSGNTGSTGSTGSTGGSTSGGSSGSMGSTSGTIGSTGNTGNTNTGSTNSKR